LQSFLTQIDRRRQVFLLLAGQIERQLREAYDRKFKAGEATQSSVAEKLGVNRSAVHRRLTGHTNMTVETIADMVWALDYAIDVNIYDPADLTARGTNYQAQQVPSNVTPRGSGVISQIDKAILDRLAANASPVPAAA
jgi:plasmid maintenance system antidote protein VapI